MMSAFTNPQKMTMVVARYNENLDWLEKVPWNYVVYNKGKKLPKWITNEIKLRNIGREEYAYLEYIISNYDALPDYTIFTPGHPFDHASEIIKKINDFDGKTGFFPLSDSVYIDEFGNREMGPELAESVRKLFVDDIKSFKYFEYPEGSVFIASKKAILFHRKLMYQKILSFMINADNVIYDKAVGYKIFSTKIPQGGTKLFHTKTTYQKIIDSMTDEEHLIEEHNRIFSSWVLEILWKTLFDGKHKTIYD